MSGRWATAFLLTLWMCGCQSTDWFARRGGESNPSIATSMNPSGSHATPAPAPTTPPQPATAESVATLLARGGDAERAGRLDAAREAYERVLMQSPGNGEAHHQLAVIADKQRNYEAAENHYRAAMQQKSNDPDLLSDFGYSLLLQERYGLAETYLQKALEIDRDHRTANMNLGYLYGIQNNYEQALAMFRKAGSEVEAQANIRHLFPNGPPTPLAAASESNPIEPPPESDSSDTGARVVDLEELSFDEVKQLMEQKRREADAKRRQQQPAQNHDLAGGLLAPEISPRAEPPPSVNRISDGSINEEFARIEAGGRPETESAFVSTVPPGATPPLGTATPGNGDTGNPSPMRSTAPHARRPGGAAQTASAPALGGPVTPSSYEQYPQQWPGRSANEPPMTQTAVVATPGAIAGRDARPSAAGATDANQQAALLGLSAGPVQTFPVIQAGANSPSMPPGTFPDSNLRWEGAPQYRPDRRSAHASAPAFARPSHQLSAADYRTYEPARGDESLAAASASNHWSAGTQSAALPSDSGLTGQNRSLRDPLDEYEAELNARRGATDIDPWPHQPAEQPPPAWNTQQTNTFAPPTGLR